MKNVIFSSLLLISFSYFATGQNLEQKVALNYLIEDFEILEHNLKAIHAGLYNYKSPVQFEEIFATYKIQLTEDLTPLEFYKNIGTLSESIADVHTEIEPPESFYDALKSDWLVFPLSVSWINEKLYVLDDFSDENANTLGQEIISINGLSANEVFRNIRKYVSRDGKNLTSPNSTLSGVLGQFRIYYASLYGNPDKFDLELSDAEGKTQEISIKALKIKSIYSKYEQREVGKLKENANPKLAFELKENVAILTVRSFHPGQIKNKGQNFKKFFKQSFKSIEKSGAKRMIIDIRGNGGGHEVVFAELFSYLTDQAFTPYRQLHTITDKIPNPELYLEQREIAGLEKWASKNLKKQGNIFLSMNELGTQSISPKKNTFTGELLVLIDGKSSSATGDFTGLLKASNRAKFIGEEAGGNPFVNTAGKRFTLVLPHSGLQIIIPTLLYTINYEEVNDGHGVMPDYPIQLEIKDVLEKKDKVMEFAMYKL